MSEENIRELTDEELAQVVGGTAQEDNGSNPVSGTETKMENILDKINYGGR